MSLDILFSEQNRIFLKKPNRLKYCFLLTNIYECPIRFNNKEFFNKCFVNYNETYAQTLGDEENTPCPQSRLLVGGVRVTSAYSSNSWHSV